MEKAQAKPPAYGAMQTRLKGRCLLNGTTNPKYVIPNNKLEGYCHEKSCTHKFVGVRSMEWDMVNWIQIKW